MLHHRMTIDVRFYELDPYNHVNHTMYLAYCEVARIRSLDSAGIGMASLERRGFRIVVTDLTAKFLMPAGADDRLDGVTDVIAIGRASHQWQQRIERNDDVLFTLAIRAAMIDLDGKPTRVPDFAREALDPVPGPGPSE